MIAVRYQRREEINVPLATLTTTPSFFKGSLACENSGRECRCWGHSKLQHNFIGMGATAQQAKNGTALFSVKCLNSSEKAFP